VHEAHIAATGATALGQATTHPRGAHPDQALMTKYYSTITQTDQAGDPHSPQTDTPQDTRPQPQHDQPERTERRGPPVASPPYRDKKRKTAERVTMPEPHGGTHRP
jgi:hypothetical protein